MLRNSPNALHFIGANLGFLIRVGAIDLSDVQPQPNRELAASFMSFGGNSSVSVVLSRIAAVES